MASRLVSMNVGSRWQQILDWPSLPFLLHNFRPFQDSCVRLGQEFDAGQRLRNGASERISITRRGYGCCFRTELFMSESAGDFCVFNHLQKIRDRKSVV